MSQKEDQELPSGIYQRQSSTNGRPPPLPPRKPLAYQSPYVQDTRPFGDPSPSYFPQPLTHSWSAQDPRSSSTQSLVPEEHPRDDKRTLLLVYIHGFMGNETSFQSFPAHIHNLVTVNLADTHHVHTKIYPRYKSRKAIEYARDDFSKWLRPHETSDTDVILIGHSMGGILSAEVVLLASHSNNSMQSDEKVHRIVGTINFDTPFLGMHPGIIPSGIGSLFRPATDTPTADAPGAESQEPRQVPIPDQDSTDWSNMYHSMSETGYLPNSSSNSLVTTKSRTSNVGSPSPATSPVNDPNFNPPFSNDVRMATRTGWGNALHFLNKHSDGLVRATRSYVTSYFEFGGCLADYKGLRDRYFRLRTLEETDRQHRNGQKRVRFANYYTASTGRPKKPKPSPKVQETEQASIDSNNAGQGNALTESGDLMSMESDHDNCLPLVNSGCPLDKDGHGNSQIPVEDDGHEPAQVVDSGPIPNQENSLKVNPPMNFVDADPVSDSENLGDTIERINQDEVPSQALSLEKTTSNTERDPDLQPSASTTHSLSTPPSLPPIPAQPQEPAAFDPSKYPEKDTRKLAEKEHSRQTKAYERAVKDRDKAIKDRRKLLEKREKASKRALEKQLKLEAKEVVKVKKEDAAAASASKKVKDGEAGASDGRSGSKDTEREGVDDQEAKAEKSKRDRKFCLLPPKVNGERDACWVRVYMRGVDEVGAHCGLFFVGEQYEWLVSDVGRRIQEWVECR